MKVIYLLTIIFILIILDKNVKCQDKDAFSNDNFHRQDDGSDPQASGPNNGNIKNGQSTTAGSDQPDGQNTIGTESTETTKSNQVKPQDHAAKYDHLNIYYAEDKYHVMRKYYDVETCCHTNITNEKTDCITTKHIVCENNERSRCQTKDKCLGSESQNYKYDRDWAREGHDWCNVHGNDNYALWKEKYPESYPELICCVLKYNYNPGGTPIEWPNSCGKYASGRYCLRGGSIVNQK